MKQIEGGATMFLAIIAPLFLQPFPDKVKWFTPAQKTYLFQKLEADHGQAETEKVGPRAILRVSKDWVLWLQGSVYMFSEFRRLWRSTTISLRRLTRSDVGTANATAFFAPTIITVSTSRHPEHPSI
jgi:hypothetical protein